MPKLVSYARASLAKAIELAEAVNSLGGSCKAASCADKMNYKVSGGFNQIVSAASKFNFIDVSDGIFKTTDDFKKFYKNAYNDIEKNDYLRKSFLSVPLYQQLYDRFKGQTLPDKTALPKFLVREYGVEEDAASRVATHFIEALEQTGLLVNGTVGENSKGESLNITETTPKDTGEELVQNKMDEVVEPIKSPSAGSYIITIKGPGMANTVEIKDQDDLEIVQLIITKLSKKLNITDSP
jgi:hypothetical protein